MSAQKETFLWHISKKSQELLHTLQNTLNHHLSHQHPHLYPIPRIQNNTGCCDHHVSHRSSYQISIQAIDQLWTNGSLLG